MGSALLLSPPEAPRFVVPFRAQNLLNCGSAIHAGSLEAPARISCQDTESSDTVSWLLVAERQDAVIRAAGWTDEEGRVIVEPAL
jgi:hypothetical protein